MFLFASALLFSACKDNTKNEFALKGAEAWIGKEIIFPDSLVFTKFAKDTVAYTIPKAKYKVLLYVDSIGCTVCKLKFNRWKNIMNEVDSLSQEKVPFLFFFHPKNVRELSYLLRRDDIKQPVCIDKKNRIQRLNHFSRQLMFQCFLLDENNKVVVVGNPIFDKNIRDSYLYHMIWKKK